MYKYSKVLDEMKANDITLSELHNRVDIPLSTLSEKLNGTDPSGFRFDDAVKIKAAIESDVPLEELFERTEVEP